MSAYSSESTSKHSSQNQQLGTKGELRAWLSSMKSMTYTKYTTLNPEMKASIMEEYKKRVQTNRSTVIVTQKKEKNTHVL
jgi:hypothetical protein